MSDMLPLATYSINVEPYDPTPAIGLDMPVTIRLTMAAIDPEAFDDEKKPSTLRMIKRNPDYDMYDYDDIDAEESEESEEEEKPKGKKHSHKHDHKHEKKDTEEEEEDDEEEEIDDEFEECVLATLSPETGYQTALDITIAPEEDIQFVVTGSYTVSLSGNYVKHPFDTPIEGLGSDEDEEDYDDEDNLDDLINDDDEEIEDLDDEQLSDELDDLEDASDIEGRIEELVAKDEKKNTKQTKQKNNKRKEQEPAEEEEESEEEEKPAKKAKKSKKVEFKKDLEEGPTKAKQQPKAKTLAGGIVVEDRVTGKGQLAKKGSRIGMRYIGKLKNGKVFDKNTSGKPFAFKLGQGEVIKGWDIGVAGMAVGGERRIVIPAPYAYGKQALPGIPANSELTFDVKLVSMK